MLPLTNLIRQYHEVEKEQDLKPEDKAFLTIPILPSKICVTIAKASTCLKLWLSGQYSGWYLHCEDKYTDKKLRKPNSY